MESISHNVVKMFTEGAADVVHEAIITKMKISTNFDSGNIQVVNLGADKIDLKIRKDTNSEFLQWFHFRLSGAMGISINMNIVNAGDTTFPEGWVNYNVCASYDREEWFRIPTNYKNGVLAWEIEPMYDSMYFAYFAPFSYEQHQEMVHDAQMSEICNLEVIGETVQGYDIDMLVIGDKDASKKNLWIICRQHPGESMAEWFARGFISRILDDTDPVSRKILEKANIYVIPNMNIDGSIAGNLRANFAGANLNREWETPSLNRSPEVYHTRNKMDEIGVDLLLDVHGDEAIPYNFVAGSEGIPSYNEYLNKLETKFKDFWMASCPDFQDTHNYGNEAAGTANLTVCSSAIAERFGCLTFTIEMPFKDNDDMPDQHFGWSDERSSKLGKSVLLPILHVIDNIK